MVVVVGLKQIYCKLCGVQMTELKGNVFTVLVDFVDSCPPICVGCREKVNPAE